MTAWQPFWRRALLSEYFILAVCAVYFAALSPITPGLASPENLTNVFSSMLPLLVVALGQTIVLITSGIDLSVTSTIALASTVGALLMTKGDSGAGIAIVAMLGIGVAIGLLNGVAITTLKMPPFIVTLAGMMFFSGLAIWLTQSRNIYQLPASFTAIGRTLPAALAVALAAAAAIHVVLRKTTLGRWIFAVGRNVRTSLVSGVPVDRTIIIAYVLSGVLAAIASILYTGRLETGSPVLGQRLLLDVIGATVIGGTSLFGGKGKVLWTVIGVLFMTVIDNSLALLGLSNFAVLIAKGSVILAAALLDAVRTRYAER
jgi:ribose/xylose/arabinose/galactoside ABC-type transport system permease subunit